MAKGDSPLEPAKEDAKTEKEINAAVPDVTTLSESKEIPEQEASEPASDDFAECWHTMFEEVFSSNPMIYHPLKDKIPTLQDGVIKVEVMNDFQKDQYEMRKRALLEYWRNHFSINVDDIEISTNEHMEIKKIIYSAEDKMKNLAEQNTEFGLFLQELNFRMKD